MRRHTLTLLALVTALAFLLPDLHGGEEFKSGLAPGRLIGGPFQPYNLNGKRGQGRFHCLVCEFGLDPVVAVFVREGPDTNEAGLQELLKKVDDAVERHQESYLHSFAVFLTSDAHSSITKKKIEDTELLVKEAEARAKLTGRLAEIAKPLKHVVIGFYPPENLKGYDLAKQPGVTVLVYAKHKVLANYAFAEGKLKSADVERVVKGVNALLKKAKKKPKQPL